MGHQDPTPDSTSTLPMSDTKPIEKAIPVSEMEKKGVPKEKVDQVKFEALLTGLRRYKGYGMEAEARGDELSQDKLKAWHAIYDEIYRFWSEEGESESDAQFNMIKGMIEAMKPP